MRNTADSMSRISTPLPPSLWSDAARRLAAVVAIGAVAGIGLGVGYLLFGDGGQGEGPPPTVIGIAAPEDGEAGDAEFVIGGTRNTTRFAGTDPAGTAAAIALATHPGETARPKAVVLAPADSWQLALAASPLVADPIGAPILLAEGDELPAATEAAIKSLRPEGIASDDGTQVIAVGGTAAVDGLKSREIAGEEAAELAARTAMARGEITGREAPEQIVVVSSEQPGYAMPAAAWAAHSGDPILFTGAEQLPEATKEVIESRPETPVYLLGPESVVSASVAKRLRKIAGSFTRIGAEGPVENSIAFARFDDGRFGWDINDPGHGFAIASTGEPIDAAIAAPLAISGKPGPLLVTADSQAVPAALRDYLLSIQPGYVDQPTRAVYNHVWIIGGPAVISAAFQEQIDVLANLVRIGDG